MAREEDIELVESEVARLVAVAKKQGVSSWDLLNIFLRACVTLHLQASVEYRIKGGT